jgi:regulator of RNase E activity RraA
MRVAGKRRMVVESVNQEVQISNIPVKPGDIVVGDQNGVLIVPKKRAEEVLEKAQATVQEEQSIAN